MDRLVVGRFVGALVAVVSLAVRAQVPEWIWSHAGGSGDGEECFALGSFEVAGPVAKAVLEASCDNHVVVFLNGERVGASDEWNEPAVVDVSKLVKPGANVIGLAGKNDGGVAAMIARLSFEANGKQRVVVTDGSWAVAKQAAAGWEKPGFDAKGWGKAVVHGKLGDAPWNAVLGGAPAKAGSKPGKGGGGGGKAAPEGDALTVADGFKVERIRDAEAGEGSWVSMAVDPKGRLYISPQAGEPILRFTLDANGQVAKKDAVPAAVKGAMGMLWAGGALYVNGNGPQGTHLYRVTDSDNDDALDKVELIMKWPHGGGEHGSHGVVLGQDNKLYVVCGNFVGLPEGLLPTSPHQHYVGDDLALPRAEDGNGFGAGEKPPGGYVVRMDLDGKNAELFAGGQRNNYDIAFNADGELFGFDSDMEWDWGAPWYRPVRAFHIVSGADHGYRGGSGKWPEWYQDSLPAAVNIGIGCPTGVRFGTGAKFPEKYQRALYIMDWTYGRLIAVHLAPNGASYGGTFENFVVGKPFNLTDMEVGADGAMYFTIGGRGTHSGLYRATYVGKESTALVDGKDKAGAEARATRRELEKFHGQQQPSAVAVAWPHLDSPDRSLRYAARVAIEFQPVAEWQAKALAETKTDAGLTALLALARMGGKEAQDGIFEALKKFPMKSLNEERQLLKLRVIEVSLARQGKPSAERIATAVEKLSPLYPANTDALNRELCQVLVALDAPGAITKTLELARTAKSREQQLYYLVALRTVTNGWTSADRVAWFSWFGGESSENGAIAKAKAYDEVTEKWFADVGRTATDGSSYGGFVRNLRKAGMATLSEKERFELAGILTEPVGASAPKKNKPLSFVKAWTMADLEPDLAKIGSGRNLKKGKEAYESAMCLMCHRFGDSGGGVGPDLTAISSRFSRRDLLESLIDPSKVVSEQFAFSTVTKKDGAQLTGRIVEDNDQKIALVMNPLAPDAKIEIKKADIAKTELSKISPMPSGLLNMLTKEDVLDLMAYLESAAKK